MPMVGRGRRRGDGIHQMRLSIYSRAMTLIGCSLALITILATSFVIQQDRVALTRELRERLVKLTEQQAISVSRSLWNLNRDGTRIVLQGVARDPDFLAATVHDDKGRIFVHVEVDDLQARASERSQAPIHLEENGAKQVIGSLSLVFSLERLERARRGAVWTALILGLVQLAAVLAATALMLRTVTKPLEAIANRMLKVAQGAVEQNVPHMERKDQIGDIARAVEIFRTETSERRKAEEALRRAHDDLERRVKERTQELSVSEERLRGVMDNVTDGIITIDKNAIIGTANLAAQRIFGYSAEELTGKNANILMLERDGSRHDGFIANDLPNDQIKIRGINAREVAGRHKDGTAFSLELAISEMSLNGEQTYVAVVRDITERKEAERTLQQAQKMEAVGQLTGGIAHDFNNLLTIILGNAETLTEALAERPELKRLAEMSGIAAQRGADLTRSLLAFSRKQVLEPKVTDVNQLVSRMEELLRRTLGEHVEINLVTHGGLWHTTVDPAQLEAAILNLAVNARDAMPMGGKLTIETKNAELDHDYARHNEGATPGPYVMVAVADTGTGMTPEVMARAFDPFFTTKEVGKGTGLGLSMVYGFAKQSHGHIKIYSEVGHGTIIKLYLPRSVEADKPSIASGALTEARGGGETILMVEDDDMVRAHVEDQIKSLGYRVMSARNGLEAMDILCQDQPIDLLFTDVVMPGGVNGPQLAVKARGLRPTIRVLYTSGYTENAVVHQEKLGPTFELLAKPYQRHDLAAKLRKILDSRALES